MAMVRATVTLPEELLVEVDRLAGARGRSAFISEAVDASVKRERLRSALDETRGALRDSPSWRTEDEAYRWVRSLREADDA
jgi:metal-responsive CopG/Arc/MetJ family transcriptional regulator